MGKIRESVRAQLQTTGSTRARFRRQGFMMRDEVAHEIVGRKGRRRRFRLSSQDGPAPAPLGLSCEAAAPAADWGASASPWPPTAAGRAASSGASLPCRASHGGLRAGKPEVSPRTWRRGRREMSCRPDPFCTTGRHPARCLLPGRWMSEATVLTSGDRTPATSSFPHPNCRTSPAAATADPAPATSPPPVQTAHSEPRASPGSSSVPRSVPCPRVHAQS